MTKNNKEPKLKILFEEGEVTKEEQVKFLFQLLDLMLDGYGDMLYRDNLFLSDKEKEEIKSYLKLSPIIKNILANYDKKL